MQGAYEKYNSVIFKSSVIKDWVTSAPFQSFQKILYCSIRPLSNGCHLNAALAVFWSGLRFFHSPPFCWFLIKVKSKRTDYFLNVINGYNWFFFFKFTCLPYSVYEKNIQVVAYSETKSGNPNLIVTGNWRFIFL